MPEAQPTVALTARRNKFLWEQAAAAPFFPAFGMLRAIRTYPQELHNRFARLLNRGSPLE